MIPRELLDIVVNSDAIPMTEGLRIALMQYLAEWGGNPANFWCLSGADGVRHEIGTAVLTALGLPTTPPERLTTSPGRSSRRRELPKFLAARIFARDGLKCLECGATENLTVDHIVPVSKGGTDEESNLRTLCRTCNSTKGDRVDP